MPDLSKLPSIERLLQNPHTASLLESYGRPLTLEALRATVNEFRRNVRDHQGALPTDSEIISLVREHLKAWLSPTLIPVINATGVILHTNMGRAPLSKASRKAMMETVSGYSNLEFNLETGKRGKRSVHASRLLSILTHTEASFVVNNNAGAVLLVLSALAEGKNVLVSRTQLVEIGGGFRIPDVMRQSGAKLVEIGTTNRLHLYDFTNELTQNEISFVLVAHHSNFKVVGFHSEPSLQEIVDIAHQHHVPVIHDLGSGALLDTANYGLAHEPTVHESVQAGCDLVCFSGDKLLGGPQGGIIIGREDLLKIVRVHPLARALRADKLTLSGLSATLLHYLKDEAETQVPIWQMIARPLEDIHQAAENWRNYLGTGEVIAGRSTVGGGSLPTEEMPTHLLALSADRPDDLLRAMRQCRPPVIARIENDLVLLDPRTVLPDQEAPLLRTLVKILADKTPER